MMKPPRAITAAGALLALAALAGCNKPTESSPPLQTPSLNEPASAPAAASAASAAGAASGASGAAGLDAAGGSGTGAGALAAVPTASVARPSDAQREAGAQIAAQGTGSTAACASCHGQHGEGNASAGFPRIAGQSYAYLLHQLDASANGTRRNAVMSPIAKALTEAQRQQAAAYYASLSPSGAAGGNAAPAAASGAVAAQVRGRNAGGGKANERGRQLAIAGDERKFVQACINCHGPGGSGEGSAYPYLGGQHQSYLLATLKAWRDGSRNTDPSGQMPVIAKALGEDQLSAVAAYYAAQPLPDRPRDAVASALTAQPPGAPASTVTSGPRGNGGTSNGTRGSGTEQGAPTTGGAQGPGGGGGGSGSGSSGSPTGAAQTGTGMSPAPGASAPSR